MKLIAPIWRIAVIGAGPAGLTLALQAARLLPGAEVTLFDARPADKDVSGDARSLALALGSVRTLQGLGAWPAEAAQPITEVMVSQAPPTLDLPWAAATVHLRAADEAVPMLGAVLRYGALVDCLQRAWFAAEALAPKRLHSRFGQPVANLRNLAGGGVEVDAGIAEHFDLAVVAEGGVFADQARKAPGAATGRSRDDPAPSGGLTRSGRFGGTPGAATGRSRDDPAPSGGLTRSGRFGGPITHDYQQTAWVGSVTLAGATPGLAIERFTREGPLALLPLRPAADGSACAAMVWCVSSPPGQTLDSVGALNDAQRIAVLNTLLPAQAGRVLSISPLKHFALGLNAERTLVDGAIVRIGNAAQTLHPVAGQGLNLGLRDAAELVQALRHARPADLGPLLRRLEWARGPDRWSMIAATDFLARSFTWRWPGLPVVRGLGLAALQALPAVKSALARQMMFGRR